MKVHRPKRGHGRRPHWDQELRELWYQGKLVKRYRQPAPCQELILRALQEHGWRHSIDDPLPPRPGKDSKQRLHQAINNLNRAQELLHFYGNGTGERFCWQPRSFKRHQSDTKATPQRN